MSRFAKKVEGTPRVINHMGAPAFAHKPEVELISILMNSMVQETYYVSTKETLDRVKELVKLVDPLTAAKIVIYGRTEMGMRSISHVVAVELAKYISGKHWAKDFYYALAKRPDDMMETLAYYWSVNGKGASLPNAMHNGFKKVIEELDAYSLAKYKMSGKDVNLIDVIKLMRPSQNPSIASVDVDKASYIKGAEGKMASSKRRKLDANAAEWDAKIKSAKKTRKSTISIHPLEALLLGLLSPAETWETKLSAAGQTDDVAAAKEEAWESLLSTKRIPPMALLRNLRNIINQAPDMVPAACALLKDERYITKKLIFPFRFLSAYAEIEKMKPSGATFEKDGKNVNDVLAALEVAVTHSVKNLPLLMGRTLILSDNSGSMHGDAGGSSAVSANSKTTTASIANLFATLYWMRADNTMVGLFGDRLVRPSLNRKAGVFDNYKTISEAGRNVGGGTETGIFKMFEELIEKKIHVDTIVVFSDCQIGTGCQWYDTGAFGRRRVGNDFNKLFEEYRKINPNFKCFSVDLRNAGSTVFNNNVIKMFGWSEKIFDLMKHMEQDKVKMLDLIRETITFPGESFVPPQNKPLVKKLSKNREVTRQRALNKKPAERKLKAGKR